MTWPYIPDSGIKVVVVIAAAAVLIFNTAAIVAMVSHYKEDKDFIYGLDIKHADASATAILREHDMARYMPPVQSKAGQILDIVFVVVAIFVALWLPLKMGLAGAAKAIDKLDAATWETSDRTRRWPSSGRSSATRRKPRTTLSRTGSTTSSTGRR